MKNKVSLLIIINNIVSKGKIALSKGKIALQFIFSIFPNYSSFSKSFSFSNIFPNFFISLSKIFCHSTWNSIKLGIRKGLEIPTLPLKLRKFYDHILIRVLRFIGGFCLILNLTKFYLSFPEILRYIILIMSAIQITQILIITAIKIIYTSYKLIYKPEEFEVRNSPLNLLQTHLGKIIVCVKLGCGVTGGAAGVVAAGATFDTLLDQAGYNKLFVPFLAEGVKAVFGNSISPKVTEMIEKSTAFSELPRLKEDQENIKSLLNGYKNLNSAGKTEFWSEIAKDIDTKK